MFPRLHPECVVCLRVAFARPAWLLLPQALGAMTSQTCARAMQGSVQPDGPASGLREAIHLPATSAERLQLRSAPRPGGCVRLRTCPACLLNPLFAEVIRQARRCGWGHSSVVPGGRREVDIVRADSAARCDTAPAEGIEEFSSDRAGFFRSMSGFGNP
jgi:hypothetical protein